MEQRYSAIELVVTRVIDENSVGIYIEIAENWGSDVLL